MAPALPVGFTDILVILTAFWLLYKIFHVARRRNRSTPLKGPLSTGFFLGLERFIMSAKESAALYEQWANEFGSVYHVPSTLGSKRLVVCDPKGIAHFFSKETFVYQQTPLARVSIENIVGRGLLWSEGESHKRQRKALSPGFNNVAIRKLTSVFFDSAYKLKSAWDSLLNETSDDGAIIDVQSWMNRISLDTVGIAGFSHDFGSLRGVHSAVAEVFDSFGQTKPGPWSSLILLGTIFPWTMKIPIPRTNLVNKLNVSMGKISDELLERTRRDIENMDKDKVEDKSVIGLLVKAENTDAGLHMSQDEVLAQMKVLILAGYETTSISLTWALIELCKNPEAQERLRQELSRFSGGDPTWDQLTHDLPYLDAVVHEVLRLHPPVGVINRVAVDDDVMPLSSPIQTASGKTVDNITIAAGTWVTIPVRCMNRSTEIWGPDGKKLIPERWLDEAGLTPKSKEIQGHRHLLTFVDGPRTCLGKGFALAEFSAVLSVLIRNYTFEFRDGIDTEIGRARSILFRPKVEGEDGCQVPLRVRRVD